jgi:GT2 family glycosyltransferase
LIEPEEVTIVIVNFNGEPYLGECLAAVAAQSVRPREVIVVDNASTDGSCKLIKAAYPDTFLVENARNRGFSGGCNDGVKRASGNWVVLLNPDTRPAKTWLEELLKRASRANAGDLVCSLIIDDDKNREHYELSATLNIVGRMVWVPTGVPEFAFSAAGASMIFEKSVYPEPFPDEYFLYHEDEYLSWKARILGRHVILARASEVPHRGSAAVRRERSLATFHGEKNRLANFLTFWEPRTRWRLLPVWVVDLLLHLPQSPAERIRAFIWVWRHREIYAERRRGVQSGRKVSDDDLLAIMSARVSPRSSTLNLWYNTAVLRYCKFFALLTCESRREPFWERH